MPFDSWPHFAAIVAAELGFSYERLQAMTFHELCHVWYPRSLEIRKSRQDDLASGVLIAIARAFGNGS